MAAGLAREGSLAQDGALRLFYLAAATQASGLLAIAAGGREYGLTFKRGRVEHAASSDTADDLGRFLLRKGALRAQQLVQAEAAKPLAGGDLAGALIAQRLVSPADMAGLLQEHGAALVSRALVAEAGSWRWEPDAVPPPSSFPLGHPWAMLCAAARALDAAASRRRLGERETRAAARTGGRVRLEDLRLTPQETRAVALFDGRSVAEIIRAAPAEASTVLRLAVLLGETELLAFGQPRAAQPPPALPPEAARPAASAPAKPAAVARPAAPARPAAFAARSPAPSRTAAAPAPSGPRGDGATPAPSPALDAAALQALHDRIEGADHFEALGVKREATGAQIKIAYFQLAKSYHPDAIPASAPPEVKKLGADVFAKVSEAWSVLGDDGKRKKYLEDLQFGGTSQVDVLKILEAEQVFQAGTLLVKVRRYDEALAKFEEAIGLNADEPEFGMWKSWCQFLLSKDRRAAHAAAASAVEGLLRKNPSCAQGYLFLGQMAKIVGDLQLAEKHLRRGLAVASGHPDLTRELKYLRR